MDTFKVLLVLLMLTLTACDKIIPESWPAMSEAIDAIQSDDAVAVDVVVVESWGDEENSNYYYLFRPTSDNQTKAFIFYPGGHVDLRAYAPPLRAIAEKGYLCFLVKMPMDLAPLGFTRANDIIDSNEYPEIDKWTVSGHSVGGTFSCAYAKYYSDKIDGLAIWASYPSDMFDLSESDLDVLLIYGTNNPNTNNSYDPDNEIVDKAIPYLPPDTVFVEIEGANHTQFGYYDTFPYPVQPQDGIADITREEQQEQIIDATLDFLGGL